MTGDWDKETMATPDRAQLKRQLQEDEWRRRIVQAGGFDPEHLSVQARRILNWLTKWDHWTADGLVELFAAARQAGQESARKELESAPKQRPARRTVTP